MIQPSWRRAIPVVTFLVAIPAAAHAQGMATDGTLTAVWGDPPAGSSTQPVLRWYLFGDRGDVVDVEISDDLLRRAGGVQALDRRRVSASGVVKRRPDPSGSAPPVLRATSLHAMDPAPAMSGGSAARVGSKPFAVLLCRFGDVADEPRPPSFFETLMGGGYPNMDHYYRELSAGQMDLTGSQVSGWFAMPRPRSDYVDATTGRISLYEIAEDCVRAAGSTVDFAAFSGIVAQYNGQFTESGAGSAYGGSMVMTLDGTPRVWPFAWMPLWAMEHSRYGIYAHELGHALGLPHSSGPYDYTYDSVWDVMSRPYLRWEPAVDAWVPGETIAFHKDFLGWIPPGQKVTVAAADRRRVRLDPHSAAGGGDGVRLVRIPIPGVAAFYTIEARRRIGYDGGLPRATVIMHRVPEPGGPDCTPHRCARVVDPSGNGNPNDNGAMWFPGETFEDGAGVTVTVASATTTGWELEVTVVVPPKPAGLTVARAADAVLANAPLTADEREYLDRMGNRNARYDLGDFLAFVLRENADD